MPAKKRTAKTTIPKATEAAKPSAIAEEIEDSETTPQPEDVTDPVTDAVDAIASSEEGGDTSEPPPEPPAPVDQTLIYGKRENPTCLKCRQEKAHDYVANTTVCPIKDPECPRNQ